LPLIVHFSNYFTINGLPKKIEFIQSLVETDSVKQMISGLEVVVNSLPGRNGHAVRAPPYLVKEC